MRLRGFKSAIPPLFLLSLGVGYLISNTQILKSQSGVETLTPITLGVPRQSGRVILVVLDGVPPRVAYDESIMPHLVGLSRRGVRGVLLGPQQSTTSAGVRALATGMNTSPADMLDMFQVSEFKGWTVFDDIVERGESVSLNGDRAWSALLGSRDRRGAHVADTDTRLYQDVGTVLRVAADHLISERPPALLVVHISITDQFAHLYGTESPLYKKRMREVDTQLRGFHERVMTDEATLVVTSDHGNDIYGSHGGEAAIYRNVPIVMFGRGIRPGVQVKMEARGLPGVLAVLLGTRIPGAMQAVVPVEAFRLTEPERATVVAANAAQLQRLAQRRAVKLPDALFHELQSIGDLVQARRAGEALGVASSTLPSVVGALDQYEPPSTARALWVAVLFCGILMIALDILWPPQRVDTLHEAVLLAATGVLALQVLLPTLVVPLLCLILVIETALVLKTGQRLLSGKMFIGFVAALGVMLLPAIRFAYMPEIKALLDLPAPRVIVLGALLASTVLLLSPWRTKVLSLLVGSEGFFVALFLLAVALLKPFSVVPIVLIAAAILTLRAAGLSWPRSGLTIGALAVFFLLSERIGFARTGEDPVARFALALGSGAVVAAVLMIKGGDQRRWLGLAFASLLLVWPFGYLIVAGASPSRGYVTALVLFPVVATAWFAASCQVRSWWAYCSLVAALGYHVYPTHAAFWIALAVHLSVLAANALLPNSRSVRQSIASITALSGLMLTSRPSDAPSIIVVALGLFFITRVEIRNLSRSATVLLAAALLVYGRYVFVDVFSHATYVDCSLKCLDEASGFLGFDETRWTWATALFSLKMLLASVLVFSLICSNPAFRAVEQPVFVVSLLLVSTFIAKAGLEAGLSFGQHGHRLSTSLSHAAYHAMVLFAIGLGYAAYKLVSGETRIRISRRAAEATPLIPANDSTAL